MRFLIFLIAQCLACSTLYGTFKQRRNQCRRQENCIWWRNKCIYKTELSPTVDDGFLSTDEPTFEYTDQPTFEPTFDPTFAPTFEPTFELTDAPIEYELTHAPIDYEWTNAPVEYELTNEYEDYLATPTIAPTESPESTNSPSSDSPSTDAPTPRRKQPTTLPTKTRRPTFRPTPKGWDIWLCNDGCFFGAANGICEDGGPNARYGYCPFGTDCTDCGDRN